MLVSMTALLGIMLVAGLIAELEEIGRIGVRRNRTVVAECVALHEAGVLKMREGRERVLVGQRRCSLSTCTKLTSSVMRLGA